MGAEKIPSRLHAVSAESDEGLDLTNSEILTTVGIKSRMLSLLSHPGTPQMVPFFFFNVYLFLRQRETEHEWGRGRERGRHRIGSRLQALSHKPRARRGA